ncbi:MAG: hypothetical protein LLG13_14845 [Bacteroidales bacterium]|nr:hypothetical protein [Bacteroidales bacterium]
MKRAYESPKTNKNLDQLICKLSENEMLNLEEMIHVRGGEADGNGSEPIITDPTKP